MAQLEQHPRQFEALKVGMPTVRIFVLLAMNQGISGAEQDLLQFACLFKGLGRTTRGAADPEVAGLQRLLATRHQLAEQG
jgi:hypothetical protein